MSAGFNRKANTRNHPKRLNGFFFIKKQNKYTGFTVYVFTYKKKIYINQQQQKYFDDDLNDMI